MGKLKILVPVKRVLDHQIKPLINSTHSGIQTQGFKFSINPFDDIAIEEALQLKSNHKDLVQSTTAISIGSDKSQEILKNCLAKGIDSVTLLSTDKQLEPLSIAKLLASYVKKHDFNLVILGKQAIDDDSNNTGQMLASLLNWPQATNACKVTLAEDTCTVTREIDGGEETLEAQWPLVITTDLRLNQPRYVGLSKLMKVKRAKIPTVTLQDFPDIDTTNKLNVISIDEPATKPPGVMLSNVDELVQKLKDSKLI